MKKFIALPLIMVLTIAGYGQQTTEKLYYKKIKESSKVYQTLTGEQLIKMERVGKTQDRIITRKIVASEANYVLRYYKKGKKFEISSSENQLLGSYKIKGKTKYDITLLNGTVYDWKKGKTGKEWSYSVNGSEVMTFKILKEDGKKYLQYNITNLNAPELSNTLLVSKVFGADLIQAKASAPAVYAGVAAGAVAIALLGTMQKDSTPDVE